VVERIFGVVKRKYQILCMPSKYSIKTQTCIILACCTLYNFVQRREGSYADILLDSEVAKVGNTTVQPVVGFPVGVISSKRMDQFRDNIAKKMWEDYLVYTDQEA